MKSIVIYATRYGCAEKAANMLKSNLGGNVSLANVEKGNSPDLTDYDNIILGGSIYMGKIQKALTNYVKANLPSLLQKRVGLFICAGQPEPVRTKELEDAFPDELFKHAVVKDTFGYEYNFDKLSFLHKIIVRKVAGVTESTCELSEQKIENFSKAFI